MPLHDITVHIDLSIPFSNITRFSALVQIWCLKEVLLTLNLQGNIERLFECIGRIFPLSWVEKTSLGQALMLFVERNLRTEKLAQ